MRDFFTGSGAKEYDAPSAIVTARTLVAVWASIMIAAGAMFIPMWDIGHKFVVVGGFFIAMGIGGFVANRQLAAADPLSRIVVSVGALVYMVLILVVGRSDPGLILPLAVGVGVVYFLWAPVEARAFFVADSVVRPLPEWLRPATYDVSAPVVDTPEPQSVGAAVSPQGRVACRQPSCVARDVPTDDNFCQECGARTL